MRLYEKIIKGIIGKKQFEKLVVFFQEFFERKSVFKIIMTRRCFVLYKVFLPILKSKKITNLYGKIITDKSMPLYEKEIILTLTQVQGTNQTAVLILDDIIIYGRTISETLDNILSNFNGDKREVLNNILVMSFSLSPSTTKIDEIYNNILLPKEYSTKLDWKRLSSQFSSLIKSACVPNTSYIVSYKKKLRAGIFDELQKHFTNHVVQINEKELLQYKIKGFVCDAFASIDSQSVKFVPDALYSCVRIYFHKKSNSVTVSPLHIFKDLSLDEFNNVCDKTINKFSNCLKFKEILSNKDPKYYSVRLRLLTLIYSHNLLVNFLSQINIGSFQNVSSYDYKQIFDYNFTEELSNDFKLLHKKLIHEQIIKYTFSSSSSNIEGAKELNQRIFKQAMQDNFFAMTGEKHRLKGLSLQEKFFSQTSDVISLIDTGKAALKSFFDYNQEIFISRIYPGEQAFRIMYDQFYEYMSFLYRLENIAIIQKKNQYELYTQFANFLSTKKLITHDEKTYFLSYINILSETGQEISDVYYITDNLDYNICLEDLFYEFLKKEVV